MKNLLLQKAYNTLLIELSKDFSQEEIQKLLPYSPPNDEQYSDEDVINAVKTVRDQYETLYQSEYFTACDKSLVDAYKIIDAENTINSPLYMLPNEIFLIIFAKLTKHELTVMARVNKFFYELIKINNLFDKAPLSICDFSQGPSTKLIDIENISSKPNNEPLPSFTPFAVMPPKYLVATTNKRYNKNTAAVFDIFTGKVTKDQWGGHWLNGVTPLANNFLLREIYPREDFDHPGYRYTLSLYLCNLNNNEINKMNKYITIRDHGITSHKILPISKHKFVLIFNAAYSKQRGTIFINLYNINIDTLNFECEQGWTIPLNSFTDWDFQIISPHEKQLYLMAINFNNRAESFYINLITGISQTLSYTNDNYPMVIKTHGDSKFIIGTSKGEIHIWHFDSVTNDLKLKAYPDQTCQSPITTFTFLRERLAIKHENGTFKITNPINWDNDFPEDLGGHKHYNFTASFFGALPSGRLVGINNNKIELISFPEKKQEHNVEQETTLACRF